MVAWPFNNSVISPLQGSLIVTPRNGVIETAMDVGPNKQRVRSEIMRDSISFQMILTDEQKATLRNFYKVTTRFGTIKFDWVHPETNEAGTAAFRLTAPPTYSHLTGGPNTTGALWNASVQMEWRG